MRHHFFIFVISLFCVFHSFSQTISPPYANYFNSKNDTTGWTHYSLYGPDQWVLGDPVNYYLEGPYSEPMAWQTSLSYASNNADMYLESPYFDLSDTTKVYNVSFKQRRDFDSGGNKKGFLEYKVPGDSIWKILNDTITEKVNWQDSGGFGYLYHDYMAHSSLKLYKLQGQDSVKFRFRYLSLPSTYSQGGWLIDDFRVGVEAINIHAKIGDTIRKAGVCGPTDLSAFINFYNEYDEAFEVKTDFYLSYDTIFDSTDTYITSKTKTIRFNSTVSTQTSNLPALSPGFYYIFYEFDVNDSVAEDNEVDNISYTVLQVDSNYSLPFIDDFESKDKGWTAFLTDDRWPILFWELGMGRRHRLENTHSGSHAWHTSRTIEYDHPHFYCSSYCNPQYLQTPPLNLASDTNDLVMNFWFKTDIGVEIQYNYNCSNPGWYTLGSVGINSDDEWDFSNFSLNGIDTNEFIQFRLRFRTNWHDPEGIIIDDFYVGPKKPDLSIERVSDDMYGSAAIGSDTITYYLTNSGLWHVTTSATSFYWSTDSILDGSDTYLGSNTESLIGPESTSWRTFGFNKPTSSVGTYYIHYVLDSANTTDEMREYNNTGFFKYFQEGAKSLPYYNDFESQISGWHSNIHFGANDWEWATPSGQEFTSAFSGSKAWVTNAGGLQTPMSRCMLYTPVFDFSNDSNIVMEFDMYQSTIINMYYSDNNGATWKLLDTSNLSFSRWYYRVNSGAYSRDYIQLNSGTSLLFDLSEKTFTEGVKFIGRNGGRDYRYSLDISQLAGMEEVRFRFNTTTLKNDTSQYTVQTEGALIDNFRISEGFPDLLVDYKKSLMLSSLSDSVKFWMYVVNLGNAMVDSSLAKFYVSADTTLSAGDFYLGQTQMERLRPGSTYYLNEAFAGPNTLSNYKYLIYQLDANNQYSESNESNNIGYWPLDLDSVSVYPYVNDFNDTIVHGWHSWSKGVAPQRYRMRNVLNDYEATFSNYPMQTGEFFTDYQDYYTGPSHLFFLQSPSFDFTGISNIKLSFDFSCVGQSGSNSDGGNLEYSIDGGNSWNLLDTNQGNASSWYTQNLNVFGEHGWNGLPGGYIRPDFDTATFDLSFLRGNGHVVFRYKYKSKYRPYGDMRVGMKVDNFKIESQNADLEARTHFDTIYALLNNPYITANYAVKNAGQYEGRPTRTRFYFSADSIYDFTDVAFGYDTLNRIAIGQTDTFSQKLKYPIPVLQKKYYLFYELDHKDSIAETNENNNMGSFVVFFDTICTATYSHDTVTACDSMWWPAKQQFYDSSGTYFRYYTNAKGCDSTSFLHLTITHSTSGTDSASACDLYTWPIDGNTYYWTGIYSGTTTASNGCDSLVTLNLTVNHSNYSNPKIKACDEYFWPADSMTYTTSGTYTKLLTNAEGCDSTATIRLTITNSDSTNESVTSCKNYFWPADSVMYNSSGIYTTTLNNSEGCDSVVSLYLTLNQVDTSVSLSGFTLTSNASGNVVYQWLNCDSAFSPIPSANQQSFTVPGNGEYAVIVAENGCIDTSACYLIDFVGLENGEALSDIKVFPNPTKDNVTIDLGKTHENIKIDQHNVGGQIVHTETYKDSQKCLFPLAGKPGIYFLTIESSSGNKIRIKVIKDL